MIAVKTRPWWFVIVAINQFAGSRQSVLSWPLAPISMLPSGITFWASCCIRASWVAAWKLCTHVYWVKCIVGLLKLRR